MLHSRASSTTKNYLNAFRRWKEWAEPHRDVSVYPVQEVHFALYLQHLGETVQSKSAVEEAVNAIGWVHQLSGRPSLTESPFVCATLSGLQRKLAKPKIHKEPTTTDMLATLVDSLGSALTLADIRLAAMSLLVFSAFCDMTSLLSYAAVTFDLQPRICQSTLAPARLTSTGRELQCLWSGLALLPALLL